MSLQTPGREAIGDTISIGSSNNEFVINLDGVEDHNNH